MTARTAERRPECNGAAFPQRPGPTDTDTLRRGADRIGQDARPAVYGVLVVDLTRHVDDAMGCLDVTAREAAWAALADAPAGVAVRVDIGRACSCPYEDFFDTLAELVADARSVEVVGQRASGVRAIVVALREAVDRRAP